MTGLLNRALSSRSGLLRKAATAFLQLPRRLAAKQAEAADLAARPPVLVNSFPKSGTHLLAQLAAALPDCVNYGTFLASMTSSFRFRERSTRNTSQLIRRFVAGEMVRGHLFFRPQFARELKARNVVHFFIYRDPRDVVVSEAHYLREMNPWHRLSPFFRQVDSIEETIKLSIVGLEPAMTGVHYPNIAARYARYQGWLIDPDCLSIRFEDLLSDGLEAIVRRMAEFYAARCGRDLNLEACVAAMIANIAPQKSHTFRSVKKAGWQKEFTAEHRRLFDAVAGDLLIELGYEPDHAWATANDAPERPGISVPGKENCNVVGTLRVP